MHIHDMHARTDARTYARNQTNIHAGIAEINQIHDYFESENSQQQQNFYVVSKIHSMISDIEEDKTFRQDVASNQKRIIVVSYELL